MNVPNQRPITPIHLDYPCSTCQVRDRALCSALESDELSYMNSIAHQVEIEAHRPIFFEEDEGTHLFNVTTGIVQLSRLLSDGRRQITGFLFPGDFLGLAREGNYAYTAEALTNTKMCRFERVRLLQLFKRFPQLETKLLDQRSNELIEAQEHMILLGRKSSVERVASLLVTFANKIDPHSAPVLEFDLPVTRESMADYLGMRLETVSRVLSSLKKQGIIELPSPHRLKLVSIDQLEDLRGD